MDQDNRTLIKGNITDISLTQIFKDHDYVFHQSALPSVPRSIRDTKSSNEANITDTLNVLIAAKNSCIKKVVCASSSSVYGDTPTLPKSENMPVDTYYLVKKAEELGYHLKVINRRQGC